jgi:hypothetical protein
VRQSQPPVPAHDEVASHLQRVLLRYLERLACKPPAEVLPGDSRTVDAAARVAAHAIRVIDAEIRVGRKTSPKERRVRRRGLVCAIVRKKEAFAKVGHPFLQLSQRSKRDGHDPGVKPSQFFQDVGLMQLHQVFGSEHSGKVPKEDKGRRLLVLAEADYATIYRRK